MAYECFKLDAGIFAMNVNKSIATFMVNTARRLDNVFPNMGFENKSASHRSEFLLPSTLSFPDFYDKFDRNGIAEGSVEQTALQTWEDYPQFAEDDDHDDDTPRESELKKKLGELRFWQKVVETDRRGMVGDYSGLILRIADDKDFNEPLEVMNSGLDALVEVIPAWEGQLKVSDWYSNPKDEMYGQPKMFQFNESGVGAKREMQRAFDIHPDRVLIWSRDGTVHGRSMLKAGFDDLMTMERIVGAGGEAFRRNATGRPILETHENVNIDDLRRGLGVETDPEIADAMAKQVEDFSEGFDKFLMLQGMSAKTLDAKIGNPEHPFAIALQSYCASWPIPAKVLVGSQTGERASSEDSQIWKKFNNARRENICKPNLMELIARLRKFGIVDDIDWLIQWSDLTESTMPEKIDRASKMNEMNAKSVDEPIFLNEEIREVMGYKEIVLPEEDDDEDDDGDDDVSAPFDDPDETEEGDE